MKTLLQNNHPPPHLPHRSPGLTAIFNELKHSNRNRVLDLGSSSARNFTFFSQLSCNIHFESLDDLLGGLPPEEASGDLLIAHLENYLTNFSASERFDVILTWDIFNYLDLEGIHWLVTRLNKFCHSNTLMHAIKYVGTQVPASPQNFHILDQYQVQVVTNPAAARRLENYSTVHLLRHMPHYYLENSYLNYSGMIPSLAEHVFRYLPERKAHTQKKASDELSQDSSPYQLDSKTPSSSRHQSAAMYSLCGHVENLKNGNILDLGLKNRNNYEFWIERAEGFYAENLYAQLIEQKSAALKPHHLNFSRDLTFDVILAWDIFNYLSLEQIKAVFQKLRVHSSSGTRIHAILYCGREIPVQPQKFYLSSEHELAVTPNPKRLTEHSLTLSSLLKALQDYSLLESYVYRPGMQRGIYEYIFAIK